MTEITNEGLKENMDVITSFIYRKHSHEWYEYCKKHRNGKQDLEQLSMLITSVTDPNPWRYIIDDKPLKTLVRAFEYFLVENHLVKEESD